MASHVIRSAIAAASMLRLCIFVLFVDLVKAFDKIIRQLVCGWSDTNPCDPEMYLKSLGVSQTAAAWISKYIKERGHLFKQWGVNHTAAEMTRTLHE
eukprot:11438684-Karenia_brevis.AAC.1